MIPRGAILGGATALLLAVGMAFWLAQPPDPPAEQEESGERLPIPPLPPRVAGDSRYEQCMNMLGSDPAGAVVLAERWDAAGGGDAAAHCRGLAQIALGEVEDGARLLERLADTGGPGPATRASIYGQAAQGWMIAGNIPRAYAASSLALSLTPDDPDLLVDHAISAATLGQYHEAAEDLSRALTVDPRRIDALVLRGSAWRHLGDLIRAQDDIDRALILDADNAEALLERGILRQRRQDRAGARADWQRAIEVAPDSPAADLAQQNLSLLEAGPSR